MNNLIKAFVVVFAVALSFVSNSCDKFDTFPLNIPFSISVLIQGSNNPSTAAAQFCLTESKTYQDYVNDIKKMTFIQAAWRTDSVKNISSGTVKVTVKIVGGATLFQINLAGTNPADYSSTPYVFSLNAAEIQALTDYLNKYLVDPNQCLEASVEATVTSGTIPYYLKGTIDMVVEAETSF